MAPAFKAVLISRDEAGEQSVDTVEMTEDALMEGDVTVSVEATTINYKDALAITGKSPIVRRFPMIPGIDLAGTVERSDHPDWKAGDKVVLNGWGVGESHYGAYAQKARVKGDWLIALPPSLSVKHAMAVGTAGYTASLCILALEDAGLKPEHGPVVVTGASGGVGSIAVSMLARIGWHVVAATGRPGAADYLKQLGAAEIVDRGELSEPGKPLGKERWAAGVDTVGSHTLANLLSQTKAEGAIAACGLAQGADLPASVMPFILRGVSLLGVNSVTCPKALRLRAWGRIESDLDILHLDAISREIGFDDLIPTARKLIEGEVRGRVVAMV